MISVKNIAFNAGFIATFGFALSVVGLSFGGTLPASADVYRWVAADGTVNYGERKPKDRDFTVVSRSKPAAAGSRIIEPPVTAVAPAPATTRNGRAIPADDNMTDDQRSMLSELQAAEKTRQAVVDNIRKSNCAKSKRVLAQMQASGRVRVRDEQGEVVIISDEARSESIRQAQESIVANCDSLS